MNAEAIDLREGLPGHWRHNPDGPLWWGVREDRGDFIVTEYEDGEPTWLAPEWTVNTLEQAREKIAMRKRTHLNRESERCTTR